MSSIVFSLAGTGQIAASICEALGAEAGGLECRRFPDGESYVRVLSDVMDKDVIVLASLRDPDAKTMQLIFLCRLLRDMHAKSISLVVPYLPYMRQDKSFRPGEAVSSAYFAQLLSGIADRLVVADPHLHRRSSMQEIYAVPCEVVHAAPLISAWIEKNISKPLLIGPDSESEQWVSEIAAGAGAPFIVLKKVRKGDRDVSVSAPQTEAYIDHTPVLCDDIISTGRTMMETASHLKATGMRPAVCIAVHAVFAGSSYEEMHAAGIAKIVTCNTIVHESNGIDISDLLIAALKKK